MSGTSPTITHQDRIFRRADQIEIVEHLLITPVLDGGDLTPHHPPVFCAFYAIQGRSRVFILSMSRVFILNMSRVFILSMSRVFILSMSRVFIFSLCCVQF